jgi:hypothetical protein
MSSRRGPILALVASAAAAACLNGAAGSAEAYIDPACGGGVLVASLEYSVSAMCNPVDPGVTPPATGGVTTSPTGTATPGRAPTTVDPSSPGTAGPVPIEVSTAPVTLDAEGRVPVTVACPAHAAGGCTGVITLSLPSPARAKRAVAARRGPPRRRVVGRSKPFQLAPGQQVVVPVSLARRGVRVVRHHGRGSAKLEVYVAVTTASGTTTVKSTITVKARQRRTPARRH